MEFLVLLCTLGCIHISAIRADIDLTHLVSVGQDEGWPGLARHKFNRTVLWNGPWNGLHLHTAEFFAPEHSGTHVDSPSHLGEGKWTIDQIPFNRLSGPGVVIDISRKADKDPDALLEVKDIKAWERLHGKVPQGAVVIMNSGWYNYYGDKKYYNWEEGYPENDTEHMHFPGFSPQAVDYLVKNSQIVGIAVDTLSIDRAQNLKFEAHQVMCKANVWGIENIANLNLLPPKGFLIYNMPLYLKDGSGSPVRVFAVMAGEQSTIKAQRIVQDPPSSSAKIAPAIGMMVFCSIVNLIYL